MDTSQDLRAQDLWRQIRDAKGEIAGSLATMHRADLLPYLFKIKNQPYSLAEYTPFRVCYERVYPADFMLLCGRQLSKSTNLSRSEVFDCMMIPNFQILYVGPLQAQVLRYSRQYLADAVRTCPIARMMKKKGLYSNNANTEGGGEAVSGSALNAPVTSSVYTQTFNNGSGIEVTYSKTSADRSRGIACDRIDFDEVQDQIPEHIPIISESLSASSFGHRRFTGTAKTTDNTAAHLFSMSTCSEWVVRCSNGHANVPDREHCLDMVGPLGPVCYRKDCKKPLDVYNGEIVHAYPERANVFFGLHIPQIVVPAIAYDNKKWSNLVQKMLKLPPATVYSEIMGIPYDVGAKMLTKEEIANVSVLGTHEQLKKARSRYSFVVAGIDWGVGSGVGEVVSFTVITVIGITVDGLVHVLYAKRYHGLSNEVMLSDILNVCRTYDVNYIAADWGVGFDRNVLIHKRTKKVVQIQYVTQNKFLTYKPPTADNPARWTVDRNTAISLMIWHVKSGKILFPYASNSLDYTQDLMSLYEQATESGSGITRRSINRDPARPDDFAHALVFAMLVAYKVSDHPDMNLVPVDLISDDPGKVAHIGRDTVDEMMRGNR